MAQGPILEGSIGVSKFRYWARKNPLRGLVRLRCNVYGKQTVSGRESDHQIDLLVDQRLDLIDRTAIQLFFEQSGVNRDVLVRLSPAIQNLPRGLADIKQIVVSPSCRRSRYLPQKATLMLNSKDIASEALRYERGVEGFNIPVDQLPTDGRTMFASLFGTVAILPEARAGRQNISRANQILRSFISAFKWLNCDEIFEDDGSLFFTYFSEQIGLSNFHAFQVELALAKKLSLNAKSTFQRMSRIILREASDTKKQLETALRANPSGVVNQFEAKLAQQVRKKYGRAYKRLKLINQSAPRARRFNDQQLALLVLGGESGLFFFDHVTIQHYLQSKINDMTSMDRFLNDVQPYINDEPQNQLFTLRKLVQTLGRT